MVFAVSPGVSPNGSTASITISSDSNGSDTGEDITLMRWIPVVVPLVALLPTLAAYFIGWGVLARTH